MQPPVSIAPSLLSWYGQAKRDLPWRRTRDPFRIWISEIMLQQTRVETVKGYYKRFLSLFPTVQALADAPQETVLKAWEGLGYYSRARNLQKAAQAICSEHQGQFPQAHHELLRLPGIGPYTAGAIASIAFGERVPAIDGNVYRVASRYFGIREDIGTPATQRILRELVTDSLPAENVGDYNQALMELGATVCIPGIPRCDLCPWQSSCDACAEGDAQLLPIHEKKRPPKPVDVAVCLLTYKNQILVMRREQRMLHGLFVFYLVENEVVPRHIHDILSENGLACTFEGACGTAKHVFTHRIWNMQLLHLSLLTKPTDALLASMQARLVTREELLSLPLPTAMKAAKQQALTLLAP